MGVRKNAKNLTTTEKAELVAAIKAVKASGNMTTTYSGIETRS